MIRILSELLNGVLAVTVVTVSIMASESVGTKYNSFSCVRPFFATHMVVKGSTPTLVKEFAGFLPCHETYETDDKGYMIFPEA